MIANILLRGNEMILLIGQIGKWSKLGDITLDVIEERLGGEAEGRYE